LKPVILLSELLHPFAQLLLLDELRVTVTREACDILGNGSAQSCTSRGR
jgi:hypothetical protein